jgi:amidohydrolase
MTGPALPTLPAIDRDRLVSDRRDLHQHPELGYREQRTAAVIAERLAALGYDVRTGVGGTGVVGTRAGPPNGPTVLIRADMDALPVQEETGLPFASTVPGIMHACGHDGHMAVALTVADRLAAVDLPGGLQFVFQPAEEGGAGAAAMIRDGVLEPTPPMAAIGMHLWSGLPTGTIAVSPGPIFAAVDNFAITIEGRGGHAAVPHETIDPVVAAAHVITALQTVVSRRRNPSEPAVLSVTAVHAGTTHNVIPERATLEGTVRSYGGALYNELPTIVQTIAENTARAHGARAVVEYERKYPATVNDRDMAELMRSVAAAVVGAPNVRTGYRTMAGEDMAFFLERVPGCYAFVGSGNPAKQTNRPHHSPLFDLDEDALPIAVELLSRGAMQILANG